LLSIYSLKKLIVWGYTDAKGRHGCDRMVVGLKIAYAISAFHH